MDKGVILLGLYVVGAVMFIVMYSSQKLYNSFVMGVFWPLTAPFIIAFLLFFSVKGSAKKVMKKITEKETTATAEKENGGIEDNKVPQKIVYIYMTKPEDMPTANTSKPKQYVSKKKVVQPTIKQMEQEFDDIDLDEATKTKTK